MQAGTKITLGLDSSATPLMVCVSDGSKTRAARRQGVKQERLLLPLVEKMLAGAGAQLPDVKRVFFVRGPGRFTGIRISLTFASMMQYLNGAQVGSATVFEVLRYQAERSRAFENWKKEHKDGSLAVVLHAFREEYFLQFFGPVPQPPRWLSKEELLKVLSARREALYCAGTDRDGLSLRALLGDKYRLAPEADCRVRPQSLIEMADDPAWTKDALEPLYLKPARFELGR